MHFVSLGYVDEKSEACASERCVVRGRRALVEGEPSPEVPYSNSSNVSPSSFSRALYGVSTGSSPAFAASRISASCTCVNRTIPVRPPLMCNSSPFGGIHSMQVVCTQPIVSHAACRDACERITRLAFCIRASSRIECIFEGLRSSRSTEPSPTHSAESLPNHSSSNGSLAPGRGAKSSSARLRTSFDVF